MPKIVFSITCHTAADCVIDQLLNFIHYAPGSHIIVHVNEEAHETYEALTKIEWSSISELNGRVWVNAQRYRTGKGDFALHRAHLSNFKLLTELNIDFDYFVLEASNSLFVRPGIAAEVSRYDCGIGIGWPDPYWRKFIHSHKALSNFLSARLSRFTSIEELTIKGCHEGTYYSRDIVASVFDTVAEIDRFCEEENDLPNYPTEEVWFQCGVRLLRETHRNLRIGPTLTYMPWDRQLSWSVEQASAAVRGIGIPDGKFLIKRVERDFNDPVRSMLRTQLREDINVR